MHLKSWRDEDGGVVAYLGGESVGDGVNEGIKVKGREVRVLSLDEDHCGEVVPGEVNMERKAVVKVGERYAVFCADWLADNDLVNVIKLIPVFITEVREGGGERERERERGEGRERGRREKGGGRRRRKRVRDKTSLNK